MQSPMPFSSVRRAIVLHELAHTAAGPSDARRDDSENRRTGSSFHLPSVPPCVTRMLPRGTFLQISPDLQEVKAMIQAHPRGSCMESSLWWGRLATRASFTAFPCFTACVLATGSELHFQGQAFEAACSRRSHSKRRLGRLAP